MSVRKDKVALLVSELKGYNYVVVGVVIQEENDYGLGEYTEMWKWKL